jgi:serine/threonine protein kinase
MSDASEQQLGQYQLTELIRRGAMSAIYKAYQPSLARFVAIKVLFFEGDPQFALRFKRSARMSAGLQHPNILQTYDFGEQGDRLFLVLQYVESGATLDSLLGAPLSLADAAQIMVRLLDALDYAHKRGIIHRDVKPANIMMPTPTWPLLGDFGIAKLRSDTQRVTSSGLTIGTPAYMSPEQATGRGLDTRTDL